MVEGGGSKDFADRARHGVCASRRCSRRLIDMLTEATITYLVGSDRGRRRGGDAVRLLGRAAAAVAVPGATAWRRRRGSSAALKARHPEVPVIGFPASGRASWRGIMLPDRGRWRRGGYRQRSRSWRRGWCRPGLAVQGNLDPLALARGGRRCAGGGCGRSWMPCGGGRSSSISVMAIVPQTPPEHVARGRLRGAAVQCFRPG